MSASAYNDPYKFLAGFGTLVVHAFFFAALYAGVDWSVQQPQGMEVDILESLPETDNPTAPIAPPVEAPPQKVEPAKPKEAEKPVPPAKAEIDITDKNKKPLVKPKEAVKPEPKKQLSKAERMKVQKEMQDMNKQSELDEQKDREIRAAQAAQAAAGAAAITSEVNKYKGLISAKIRHNIVLPPDVADNAEAVFVVTLLVDGSVLDAKLRKSSGNAAYDDAVERAIWRAKSLPLPQDEAARKQFVNPNPLILNFSPKNKE